MAIKSLPRETWPEALRTRSGVAGVATGGCFHRKKRFSHRAHAHTDGAGKGWICYMSEKHLEDHELALHELAHIITGEGHTEKWRKCLTNLGGTVPAHLRKRVVARGGARHSWGPEKMGYDIRYCRKCGVKKYVYPQIFYEMKLINLISHAAPECDEIARRVRAVHDGLEAGRPA